MKKVNQKLKSRSLEVVLLGMVSNYDSDTVSVSCSSAMVVRLQEYSKTRYSIPDFWNNEANTFLGIPIIVSEEVPTNILVVNPSGQKLSWL